MAYALFKKGTLTAISHDATDPQCKFFITLNT